MDSITRFGFTNPVLIDIALTGFSIAEVDLLLDPDGTPVQADTGCEDELSCSQRGDSQAVTRSGDV